MQRVGRGTLGQGSRDKGRAVEEDEVADAAALDSANARVERGLELAREKRAKSREAGLRVLQAALQLGYDEELLGD
jgi:hypothetical protein